MDQPLPDVQDQPPQRADADGEAHYAVPNLLFENYSGLEALQFDTIDQYGQPFHIVVAKAAYTLGRRQPDGLAPLIPAATPAPLAAEDRHGGGDASTCVLQENDFAPYKPRCDVIVNATAHAPMGQAVRQFVVGLTVLQPERAAPAPVVATAHLLTAPVENRQSQSVPLIHKSLRVCGERNFKRKWAAWRLLLWTVKIASLGLLRIPPWRLTRPAKFIRLPLQYTYAQGGECRIDAKDPDAKYVPGYARLPADAAAVGNAAAVANDAPTSLTAAANAAAAAMAAADHAIAHEACQSNPLGRGFTRRWYLDAKRIRQLPAPRITTTMQPCSAGQFWSGACGTDLPEPAGFGCVGRAWLPRRSLAGNIEERAAWQPHEVPSLPPDFDFAYWNSAPGDQQCAHLEGQESITLTNLCAPEHASASIAARGDTVLRFRLPQQTLFLMLLDADDAVATMRLVIDTVVIDPEASRVELVWRVAIDADGGFQTARLLHLTEPAQMERLRLLEELQEQTAYNEPDDAEEMADAADGDDATSPATLAATD